MLLAGCQKEEQQQTQETQKTVIEEPEASTAETALAEIQQSASPEFAGRLGFDAGDDLSKATLGEPAQVYVIGLQQARAYSGNEEAMAFLGKSIRTIYPVNIEEVTKSSVGLSRDENGGEWKVTSMGRPRLSRSLAQLRQQYAAAAGVDLSGFFVVEVPACYFMFLGHQSANGVVFIHTADNEDLGFVRGKSEVAGSVLSRVREFARTTEGALVAGERAGN